MTETQLKKIEPLVEQATSFEVTDADTMSKATEFLSELNAHNDRIKETKEKVTKPLNEALKEERARWKPAETILTVAIATMRRKIGLFQTQEKARVAEKEAKIAARVGEGKGKLKVETAIDKMEEIDRPASVVSTQSGTVKFRTTKMCEVEDITKVPYEYLTANMVAIRASMKDNKEIPGVRYWTEETVVNSR